MVHENIFIKPFTCGLHWAQQRFLVHRFYRGGGEEEPYEWYLTLYGLRYEPLHRCSSCWKGHYRQAFLSQVKIKSLPLLWRLVHVGVCVVGSLIIGSYRTILCIYSFESKFDTIGLILRRFVNRYKLDEMTMRRMSKRKKKSWCKGLNPLKLR